MQPQMYGSNVRARCPDCGGAVTTFEAGTGGAGHGAIVIDHVHKHGDYQWKRIVYQLLRCAGCGRGGLSKIHCDDHVYTGIPPLTIADPDFVCSRFWTSVAVALSH